MLWKDSEEIVNAMLETVNELDSFAWKIIQSGLEPAGIGAVDGGALEYSRPGWLQRRPWDSGSGDSWRKRRAADREEGEIQLRPLQHRELASMSDAAEYVKNAIDDDADEIKKKNITVFGKNIT